MKTTPWSFLEDRRVFEEFALQWLRHPRRKDVNTFRSRPTYTNWSTFASLTHIVICARLWWKHLICKKFPSRFRILDLQNSEVAICFLEDIAKLFLAHQSGFAAEGYNNTAYSCGSFSHCATGIAVDGFVQRQPKILDTFTRILGWLSLITISSGVRSSGQATRVIMCNSISRDLLLLFFSRAFELFAFKVYTRIALVLEPLSHIWIETFTDKFLCLARNVFQLLSEKLPAHLAALQSTGVRSHWHNVLAYGDFTLCEGANHKRDPGHSSVGWEDWLCTQCLHTETGLEYKIRKHGQYFDNWASQMLTPCSCCVAAAAASVLRQCLHWMCLATVLVCGGMVSHNHCTNACKWKLLWSRWSHGRVFWASWPCRRKLYTSSLHTSTS